MIEQTRDDSGGTWKDPVVEAYKRDVDRTLLRKNLQLTVEERFQQFESFMEYFYELRAAGAQARNRREA